MCTSWIPDRGMHRVPLNGCTVCFTLSRLRMHTIERSAILPRHRPEYRCIGSPPPTDQTVNSSVADASILRMPIDWVTQRWRFWHKHLSFMYSQATVRSYTKDRAVLRRDHSLKRGSIRWFSETNSTDVHMARQRSGKPQYGYKSWDNVVQIGIAPATTKNIVVVIL